MTRHLDLLVLGELNPDVVVVGAPDRPRFGQVETVVDAITLTVGSSSAIVACGAARLGLRVAFVGVVGDDAAGRLMLEALADRGIDVSGCRVDPVRPTGATVLLARGADRAILTAIGTIGALRVGDVPADLLARARHVHVGSLYLQAALRPDLSGLLRAARRRGASVSLDPNWDPAERWAGFDDLLAETDVFLPNEAEARALTGAADPRAAAGILAARMPAGGVVAVKRGAAGAGAWRAADWVESPPLAVDVVDTVGAGDSFDAGVIAGYTRGWPVAACLELGVACGAASTRRAGGVDGQPTLDDALALLAAAGRPIASDASAGALPGPGR